MKKKYLLLLFLTQTLLIYGHTLNFSSTNDTPVTYRLTGLCREFVIDVYSLDNSFNLNIDGSPIIYSPINGNELQFQGLNQNIKFQDGNMYGTNVPNIFNLISSNPSYPIFRMIVSPNGTLQLFGSKRNNGPLYPLELFNGTTELPFSFNTISNNIFTISQVLDSPNYLNGDFSELETTPTFTHICQQKTI